MQGFVAGDGWELFTGDCRNIMLTCMGDNSVDSVVCDPPYELGFMGKSWDNTGIAYDVAMWKEVLRVLKPGGHLLSFGGSRTYHRMACAIEDAGFEIRDQIMWVYGSGFPKSMDVSKAIDKAAGAEREVVGVKPGHEGFANRGNMSSVQSLTGTMGGDGGFARPWMNDPEAVEKYHMQTAPSTPEAKQWEGWGTALKPAHEPIVMARKPLIGTVAANVLMHGTGALNIDASRVRDGSETGDVKPTYAPNHANAVFGVGMGGGDWKNIQGRFPANLIHDGSDEVLAAFPVSSTTGTRKQPDRVQQDAGSTPFTRGKDAPEYTDSGSAARFFYCAKTSRADRNEGCGSLPERSAAECVDREEGSAGVVHSRAGANRTSGAANIHPTVKPNALMRYLVRMVTPPNGIVFDPFTGSGSTGKAAMQEGFQFKGCELSAEYSAIAAARIAGAIA